MWWGEDNQQLLAAAGSAPWKAPRLTVVTAMLCYMIFYRYSVKNFGIIIHADLTCYAMSEHKRFKETKVKIGK